MNRYFPTAVGTTVLMARRTPGSHRYQVYRTYDERAISWSLIERAVRVSEVEELYRHCLPSNLSQGQGAPE